VKVSIRFFKTDGIPCDIKIPAFTLNDESLATPETRAAEFERAYQMAMQVIAANTKPSRVELQWPPSDTVPLAIRD
jgi:hypothetical protein